jgi:hypothetical protein
VGAAQVTLKKECYKKNAHVAFSYKGYEKNEDTSVDHKCVVHVYGKCPPVCLTAVQAPGLLRRPRHAETVRCTVDGRKSLKCANTVWQVL